jgi:methylenetetrahydrofolate dehydrogenase (NADP+)/methenyltetrahydrofolate cyclohydrolase
VTSPATGATAEVAIGARLLLGIPLAKQILQDVTRDLDRLRGRDPERDGTASQSAELPGVSVIMVGGDPASQVYASRILGNAERVGLPGRMVRLAVDASTSDVIRALEAENADRSVAGIIVQLPLPGQVEHRAVIEAIDPAKDIDGIHPYDAGLLALGYESFYPSCAEASVEILRWYGIKPAGMRAVVIGRSNVVGKPAELLLLRENATVTVCHRQTRDLPGELRRADLIVVAAGSPGLVRGDMLQSGAAVVDCGINVLDGRIVGDVDMDSVRPVASALTPVPGGVGPLTNAILLEHLARAVRRQVQAGRPAGSAAEAALDANKESAAVTDGSPNADGTAFAGSR